MACVALGVLGLFCWSIAHWVRRSRGGLGPTWYGVLVLVGSGLTLVGLGVGAIYLYLSMPSDEEVFEDWVGLKVTDDVEILTLHKKGFGDFLELQVCFKVSAENIEALIQTRQLVPVQNGPPTNDCVGTSASYYQRMSGAGTGSGRMDGLNGFGVEEHGLAYDADAGTAFYTFFGLD